MNSTEYTILVNKYNELVDKHNALCDDYTELTNKCNEVINSHNELNKRVNAMAILVNMLLVHLLEKEPDEKSKDMTMKLKRVLESSLDECKQAE